MKAQVIPNGIDPAPYSSDALNLGSRRRVRDALNIPESAFVIGHIGRLAPPKNHQFLLDIFREVLAVEASAHLVLVGDGPLRFELDSSVKLSHLESRVHFLGVRTDVPELLNAMDAFVFPSLYEGLGIALIEAQASGLPCRASDTVPVEADLDLGLIERISLSIPARIWAAKIIRSNYADRPSWEQRLNALQTHGFDIATVASLAESLYRTS